MRAPLLVCSAFFAALAGVLAWRVSALPWTPHAPFDLAGVLWLLTNIPKLVGWGGVLLLSGASGYFLFSALRLPGRRPALGVSGEEERLRRYTGLDDQPLA